MHLMCLSIYVCENNLLHIWTGKHCVEDHTIKILFQAFCQTIVICEYDSHINILILSNNNSNQQTRHTITKLSHPHNKITK